MSFEITSVELWEGDSEDRPGMLSEQLAEIMRTGTNLDVIVSRPGSNAGDPCKVLLGPLHGAAASGAARESGLKRNLEHWLRLEGPDRPWLAAGIARTVADVGINIRSFTGTVIGDRCVIYISFATAEEARRAAQVLTPVLG